MLGAAAIAAWVLAAVYAGEAIGSVFAVVGFVMFLAAVFNTRLREVTREGVKMDPKRVIEAGEDTPIRADDTPAEAKARVLEAVSRSMLREGMPVTAPPSSMSLTPRQTMMERDRRRANVLSYFAQWLQADGYDVRLEQQTDTVRLDVVATREGRRILAELRPVIDSLRESDARAIAARWPVARSTDGDDQRLVVLTGGTSVEPTARTHLDVQGIAIYFVDPDSGSIQRMDPATGQLEIVSPGPPNLLS